MNVLVLKISKLFGVGHKFDFVEMMGSKSVFKLLPLFKDNIKNKIILLYNFLRRSNLSSNGTKCVEASNIGALYHTRRIAPEEEEVAAGDSTYRSHYENKDYLILN